MPSTATNKRPAMGQLDVSEHGTRDAGSKTTLEIGRTFSETAADLWILHAGVGHTQACTFVLHMLGDNFENVQLETYSGNLPVETDRGTFGLSPNACFVKQSGTINLLEWTPELKPGPASGAQT